MTNCILREMWYVPVERLPNVKLIKERMQVKPVWFKTTYNPYPPKPIPQCYFGNPGYVGFPIWYGMEKYPDENFIDQRSRGGVLKARCFPDPHHEQASPDQDKFMAALIEHFKTNTVGLAKAGTGTGKTVSALNLAGKRGRSTLVITDREHLSFDQWIPEAMLHLGLPENEIGIVQGKKCEYDKPFVAAIAKSLIEREYDPEFYDAFGTVIFDELDVFGTNRMSRVLQMFSAECRLGMTATVERPDKTEKLYTDYFGPPRITAKSDAMPFQVRVVDYWDKSGERLPKNHGMIKMYLARDEERNRTIVKEIMKLYNDDRSVLVIGDDIRHLQRLEEMCWKLGVPEDATGQFSRERYIFTKHKAEHKGEQVIVKRQKKSRVKSEYLNWVKKNADIIFATYGMMKRGTNIPRLDAGIDATPRSEAVQTVGRIRRPWPGKKIPLWVTIRDRQHEYLVRIFQKRMSDYVQLNAEILE